MINSGLYSSQVSNWATPQWLFNELDSHYHFTLDPCAEDWNHKCNKWYSEEQDGLKQEWSGERVFMNPPYGREIGKWVEKAIKDITEPSILLLPCRTDTKWFRSIFLHATYIGFVEGRLRFERWCNLAPTPSPFPSCLVVLKYYDQLEPEWVNWVEVIR